MNIIKTEKGYYYKIYKNNTNNHNTKINKLQALKAVGAKTDKEHIGLISKS